MLNRYPTWSVAGVNLFESQVLVFCYYTPMLALMLQSYVLKKKGARRLWWSTRLNSLIHIITACRGTSTTPGCGLFAADIREHGKGRFAAVSKKMNLKGPGSGWIPPIFTHGPSNFLLDGGSEMDGITIKNNSAVHYSSLHAAISAKKAKPIPFFSLPRPWTHSLCREMTLMQECSGPEALLDR